MIDTRPLQPQPDRQRPLARQLVRRHIADVVDIQHRHGQQAATRGRQQQPRIEGRCLDVVAPQHAHPAKEDQHRQVAQPGIAIGPSARRVGNRRADGRAAQNEEHDRRGHGRIAKGQPQQEYPGDHCQYGYHDNGANHLPGRHQSALDRARRPGASSAVRPVLRIAVVVGQIGEYLQQDGRNETQQGDPPVEQPISCGQRRTHDDTGYGQRQGSRPRGRQPYANDWGFGRLNHRYG